MLQQKYENVKKVYFDTATGTTSSVRETPDQIKFDSTAEYKLFQLLSNVFPMAEFILACQANLTVNGVSWKLDFQVEVRDRSHTHRQIQLAELANKINGTSFSMLNNLYFEYKGLQDKNFKSKMKNLITSSPMTSKTVILVGSDIGAYCDYCHAKEQFLMHPIVSVGLLHHLLLKIV